MPDHRLSYHKLQTLQLELDAWRAQQTKRTKLPQHFWDQAFQLLDTLPISVVSQQLRLDYQKLREHRPSNSIGSAPTFLELKASEITPITTPPIAPSAIVSEKESTFRIIFERKDGAKLTLKLTGDLSTIEGLCQRFLRG